MAPLHSQKILSACIYTLCTGPSCALHPAPMLLPHTITLTSLTAVTKVAPFTSLTVAHHLPSQTLSAFALALLSPPPFSHQSDTNLLHSPGTCTPPLLLFLTTNTKPLCTVSFTLFVHICIIYTPLFPTFISTYHSSYHSIRTSKPVSSTIYQSSAKITASSAHN